MCRLYAHESPREGVAREVAHGNGRASRLAKRAVQEDPVRCSPSLFIATVEDPVVRCSPSLFIATVEGILNEPEAVDDDFQLDGAFPGEGVESVR